MINFFLWKRDIGRLNGNIFIYVTFRINAFILVVNYKIRTYFDGKLHLFECQHGTLLKHKTSFNSRMEKFKYIFSFSSSATGDTLIEQVPSHSLQWPWIKKTSRSLWSSTILMWGQVWKRGWRFAQISFTLIKKLNCVFNPRCYSTISNNYTVCLIGVLSFSIK